MAAGRKVSGQFEIDAPTTSKHVANKTYVDSEITTAVGTSSTIATVTLTTAQILALDGTAVTVLAAPAAGKVNIIKSIVATKVAGVAYGGIASGEDIDIRYTDASGAIAATLETLGFLDSTAAKISYATGLKVLPVTAAVLVAHLSGPIITGDSDVILRIEYMTVSG